MDTELGFEEPLAAKTLEQDCMYGRGFPLQLPIDFIGYRIFELNQCTLKSSEDECPHCLQEHDEILWWTALKDAYYNLRVKEAAHVARVLGDAATTLPVEEEQPHFDPYLIVANNDKDHRVDAVFMGEEAGQPGMNRGPIEEEVHNEGNGQAEEDYFEDDVGDGPAEPEHGPDADEKRGGIIGGQPPPDPVFVDAMLGGVFLLSPKDLRGA